MALNYMHQKNIVHRDIKPENILIEDVDNLEIKVTDFGFATFFDSEKKLDEVLGSPIYMPPEIVKKQLYDSKVDVWSAGVVVFILLSGTPPFVSESKEEVFRQIKDKVHTYEGAEWSKVSSHAKNFLKLCLDKNPRTRPSAEQLLNHPWLAQEPRSSPQAQQELNDRLAYASANLASFCRATNF